MPEHRFLSRFVYLLLAGFMLAPLTGLVAEEPLPEDPDVYRTPVIDITERAAGAAAVPGEVKIFLQGKAKDVRAKRQAFFKVEAVDAEGVLIRDAKLKIDWGDGKSGQAKLDRRVEIFHTWKKSGSFVLSMELIDKEGTLLARGKYRLRVGKQLRYAVQIIGDDRAGLDQDTKYRFVVFTRGGPPAKGILLIDWGDGETDRATFTREVSFSHKYTDEGTYKVRAVFESQFGETKKSRPFRVNVEEGGGSIDLAQAQIAPNSDRDIENYRVTSTVTGVSVTRLQICIFHTKAGRWPVRDGLEGNPWVATFYQGRLHAGTYEWLRPGQTCKGIDASKSGGTHKAIGPHVAAGPLSGWVPKKGDRVWFFTSTHARLNIRSSNERAEPFELKGGWPF